MSARSGHSIKLVAPYLMGNLICLMSTRPTGRLFGRYTVAVQGMLTEDDFHLINAGFDMLSTAWAAVDFAAGRMFAKDFKT